MSRFREEGEESQTASPRDLQKARRVSMEENIIPTEAEKRGSSWKPHNAQRAFLFLRVL